MRTARFFLVALALFIVSCQPQGATVTQADLDAAEAEVAAELDAFWEVWRASSFDEGMAYYSDDPAMTFITDGYLWESKAAAEEAYRPAFAAVERQEMEVSETRIHALSPGIVVVVQEATYVQYTRSGEVSPAREFALSMTWVKEGGEWKAMTYHYSQPNPAPATLKSVHLVNVAPGSTQEDVVEIFTALNAGIQEAGYPDAGYSLWKIGEAEEPDTAPIGSDYFLEGLWPDQATYDQIHQAEAFQAAIESVTASWQRVLADQSYARVDRIDVGGPGER
jgi:ketosteroid isomerase-like protein